MSLLVPVTTVVSNNVFYMLMVKMVDHSITSGSPVSMQVLRFTNVTDRQTAWNAIQAAFGTSLPIGCDLTAAMWTQTDLTTTTSTTA